MDKNSVPARTAIAIAEEVLNSTIHGIGAVAAVVGMIIGLVTLDASPYFVFSFVLYSVCLILLLTTSSLYHALKFTRARHVFRILDHSGIFLLIAGSYTPFVVTIYSGWAQVMLLAVVWMLALLGIVLKAAVPKAMSRIGVGVYLALGWLAVVFIPKLDALPLQVVWLAVAGGLLYTFGAALLTIKKPFIHAAWHVFVVAAASMHFFAITRLA